MRFLCGLKLVVKQIFVLTLKKGNVTMFLEYPCFVNRILKGILKGIREKGIVVYGIIKFLLLVSGAVKKAYRKKHRQKAFKTVLDKAPFSSIRVCISGGGPLPPSTFKIYNQLGLDFIQGYGLTENFHP